MLLMALFAPWAANAQETANVVSGGTGTNQYVPMYNYYNDYGHRSEYIIPASYFSEAGISEGAQLTSITIYRSATGSWTAKDLTIILTNTLFLNFKKPFLLLITSSSGIALSTAATISFAASTYSDG